MPKAVIVPDGVAETDGSRNCYPHPRHPLKLVKPHITRMLNPVAVALPWCNLLRFLHGVEDDVEGPVPDGVDVGTISRFMECYSLLSKLLLGYPVDTVVLRVVRIEL